MRFESLPPNFPLRLPRLAALLLCFLLATHGICPALELRPDPEMEKLVQAAQIREKARQASQALREATGAPAPLRGDSKVEFRAGMAEVDITSTPQRLDGYWSEARRQPATQVHSPLMARALVLDDGRTRVALVNLDLIALYYPFVRQIREMQRGVSPDHVIVCATHTHSAPSTLGVFAPVDQAYLGWVCRRVAEAIDAATANLAPARVGFARASLNKSGPGRIPGVARNVHSPDAIDPALLMMRVELLATSATAATLVNMGCHPDVLGGQTNVISRDWPAALERRVTPYLPGMVMLMQRGLGGVEPEEGGAKTVEAAEAIMDDIGETVGGVVVPTARNLEWCADPRIAFRSTTVQYPVLSEDLIGAFAAGKIPHVVDDGQITNDMMLLAIGPARMITVPGEPMPQIVDQLVDMLRCDYPFVLALANDEVGYIIDEPDYRTDGSLEKLSAGPDNALVTLRAAAHLLGVDAWVYPGSDRRRHADPLSPAADAPAPAPATDSP